MAAWLLRRDGLFVGSSAAMNCVGAVKVSSLRCCANDRLAACWQGGVHCMPLCCTE